jgi:hypothetical protein
MLAVGALGILVILSLTGVINPLGQLFENPPAKVNAPGPAIVQQLRARNEWITFSYQADQLIEASRDGNFLQDLLFGDRILLQARGEVAAGIDMSQLRDDQIISNGSAITITLPPARIIYSKLDNNETRIYDRERGWLSKGDINLETDARTYAEVSITKSACESGILDRAAAEGRTNISDFLTALNYTSVTVYVSKVSNCETSAISAVPTPDVGFNPTAPANIPTVTVPGGAIPTTRPSDGGLSGTGVPITPQP